MIRHWITVLPAAFFVLSFAACNAKLSRAPEPAPAQKSAAVPEITSESEEDDFYDLVFALGDIDQLPDGGQRFVARGTHQGNAVEVEVSLRPGWKGFQVKEGLSMSRGQVVIRSLGPASDALLRAMDALYKTKLDPKRMAQATAFTAISLSGDPANLRSGPVELKLFFESDDEERYAELYLNMDAAESRVVVGEKDPEYRKAIILALTSKDK